MTMKKFFCLVAALLLVPAVAAADDLSATLSGGGGSGIAAIQTDGSSVSYSIITNGIGNVTGAQILQGSSTFVDLNASSGNGSAAGSVSTAANLSDLNSNTGGYSVRVTGSSGTISGPLANAGESGDGGGPGDGEDDPGTVGLDQLTFTVTEVGGDTVMVAISRSGGSDGAVSVDYTTVDGTATAGSDYTAASGTVDFADGEGGTQMVPVTILDDGDSENAESFTFVLSNAAGGADLGDSTATITILDDDTPCVPDASTLCLLDGRFEVTATYAAASGASGQATKIEETDDTGLFWFFNQQNIEIVVKVLDACVDPFNRYWVFAGGLTDVAVELTVRDSASGLVSEYSNPQQTPFQPIQDTDAFATCDVN